MKTIKRISILLIIAVVSTFPSCSSGDDPTISIDEKLGNTWKISSARLDGADVTNEFSGFGITFSSSDTNSNSGSYTINGGYDLIDGSGSYTINGASSLSITTNKGKSITASISLSNEDKTLTFSFNNPTTTFGGGRIKGTKGDYLFVLNK